MATKQLTPRQQEIVKLMDQGKTPTEVAKRLKITDNAVYQHLRRIRQVHGTPKAKANGAKPTKATTKASTTKRTTTRRASGRNLPLPPKPKPAAPAPQPQAARHMTPLQAIRARRDEIDGTLKEVRHEAERAAKAATTADEARKTAEARFKDELAQLEAAEAALTGTKAPAAKKNGAGSKRAGKQAAAQAAESAPAAATAAPAPTPEPETAPATAAAAEPGEEPDVPAPDEALVGAGEQEYERPGVPVDPEFDQSGQDAFSE